MQRNRNVDARPRRNSVTAKYADVTVPVRLELSDVLWWDKTTEREPFTRVARNIKRGGGKISHALWMHDGTIKLVMKEPKPFRARV